MFGTNRTRSSSSSLVSCCFPLRPNPPPLLHAHPFLRYPFLCLSRWSRPLDTSHLPSDEACTSSSVLSARVSSNCSSSPKRTCLPCLLLLLSCVLSWLCLPPLLFLPLLPFLFATFFSPCFNRPSESALQNISSWPLLQFTRPVSDFPFHIHITSS